ncbi:MAG TPA: MBL fold metallo-hydrolase, partial [Candidatus Ozemobacteraceae bacterium]|nr:MBL fold metallo-hydrolase [Candidatus Ozemobacteraceae bacterium]
MNVLRLQRLTDRVQIIPGPTIIGVILLSDDRVAIIDSGLDRRAGRRLYELLRDYHYKLDVILNTHAHADHIGGNSFLHRTTQCRILAGPLEAPVIRHPLIQAVTLFGGAPPKELQNRMLTGDASPAEDIRGDSFELDGLKIDVIPLPGHSIGQVGFVVDGVAFLADALFAPSIMEKHKLVYMYDPGQQRQT